MTRQEGEWFIVVMIASLTCGSGLFHYRDWILDIDLTDLMVVQLLEAAVISLSFGCLLAAPFVLSFRKICQILYPNTTCVITKAEFGWLLTAVFMSIWYVAMIYCWPVMMQMGLGYSWIPVMLMLILGGGVFVFWCYTIGQACALISRKQYQGIEGFAAFSTVLFGCVGLIVVHLAFRHL